MTRIVCPRQHHDCAASSHFHMAFSACDKKNGPLRLVYLCNEYPPASHGGIGAFTALLATRLVARGHSVHVVGLYRCKETEREHTAGVAITRLPANMLGMLGFLINRRRIARELWRINAANPIDVVEGPENALSLVPRRFPATKLIRMHGGHHFFSVLLNKTPRFSRAWVEQASFKNADSLCAVSHFVAAETSKLLGLEGRPVEIIPNSIDTAKFRPMPEVPVISGRIVFVGTLCEKKGIPQLVQAMPEILAAVPNAHLVACGRDSTDRSTGQSFKNLLECAMSSQVRRRITFKDHVDNEQLPRELATAEVLVYPSHMEALGVAWLEGMAMGKPVVASKTGPGPEVIEDGKSGLLCNPHDPHSIAESVIRCLKDPVLASRLAAAARERAVQEFSVEKLVVRNEEFYLRCLEEKTRG
jgi:glycosyltransferase involved in cell wall biosynthesis